MNLTWVHYALSSAVFIGIVSVIRKSVTNSISSTNSFLIETSIYGLVVISYIIFSGSYSSLVSDLRVGKWLFLSSILLIAGILLVFKTFEVGPVGKGVIVQSVAVMVFTLILSFVFLGENYSIKNIIGIIFAVLSIYMLV